MDEGDRATTRRRLLATAGGLTSGALAGCSERLWSRAEDAGPGQVALTIKTVPADDDAIAATILNQLRENYRTAGIDVTHEPVAEADLYRDVLIEGDYDVFVLRHPGLEEFDELRGLLHSRFVTEAGWQNPFHYSNVTADDLLERQLRPESDREEPLSELFEFLEETAPYTVVAYPYQLGGTRTEVRAPVAPRRAVDYFDVLASVGGDRPDDDPLVVGVFGEGLVDSLNPIVVDRNRIDGLLDLVYDPLVRRFPDEPDDTYVPWLVEDITWEEGNRLVARVTLRSGTAWHDGVELDAEDVAFTWRFLRDTSLGEVESGVPAPRFRARGTLLDNVAVLDSRTLELTFTTSVRSAALRTLTTPVLPEHVWKPRSEVVAERRTEALVDANESPIGSGLYVLEEATVDTLTLERFDDHVLVDVDEGERPDVLEDASSLPGIRIQLHPNVGAMIDALVDDEIDVTASNVPPENLEAIRESSEVAVVSEPTEAFYMIGYNLHHPELGNPRFRRALSKLIDRNYVASELFDGYAEPATTISSLVGVPPDRWPDSRSSTIANFPGTDGEIGDARVRTLFEEAGYQYDDGVLLE